MAGMTEQELRDWILRSAGRSADGAGPSPPFVEVVLERHPDDYGERRAAAYAELLGEPDLVYRPALGTPFVEIACYPPTGERRWWYYVTNGMSDFPLAGAGAGRSRLELADWSGEANAVAANLLHDLATEPYRTGVPVTPGTLALPTGRECAGFAHVLLSERSGELLTSSLEVADEPVRILLVTPLSPAEFEHAKRQGVGGLTSTFDGEAEGWTLDARFGLEPRPRGASDAAAASANLGCLTEATDSPCPSCGGELHETLLPDDPEPFLVCTQCGWSRAQSTLEHSRPYLWAVDRFRAALGDDCVDFDTRPGGEGVIVRVNVAGKSPALVELKSPVWDINREPDRDRVLAEKLARVQEYLCSD